MIPKAQKEQFFLKDFDKSLYIKSIEREFSKIDALNQLSNELADLDKINLKDYENIKVIETDIGLKEITEKEYKYWKSNPIKKFYKDKFFISFLLIISTMLFMMFHPTFITHKVLNNNTVSALVAENTSDYDYYYDVESKITLKENQEIKEQ